MKMMNTIAIKARFEVEGYISLCIATCNFLLFAGLVGFIFDTPAGQSMNPLISFILLFASFSYAGIIYPELSTKYLSNRHSKLIEEHSNLIKEVLPYNDELCVLILYDGNDLKEALKNGACTTIKVPLTPKWEKMIKENENKYQIKRNE